MSASVVIAGKSGFIGSLLTSLLADRGIEAADVRDFVDAPGTAKVLVNLANIPEDPAADRRLLDERIRLVGRRAERWLQIQSFITLHGRGELDLGRFNAGFTPVAMDRYAIGKIMEERRLGEAAQAGEVGRIAFAYLPAVLDEGGAWARARQQANLNGYVLPGGMRRTARANFTYVVDLAELVVAWASKDDVPSVGRVIVNDPLSRTTTWPDLLGPNQLSPGGGGTSATLKHAARQAKGRASALGFAGAASVGRLGPPARPTTPVDPGAAEGPAGPLEFHTALRYLVRRQTFLPPTPYR